MEINTNYVVGILIFIILILLFSKVQVSTSGAGGSVRMPQPSYTLQTSSMHNNVGNETTFLEAQGMPQKNNAMSNEMRAYINSLEDSMYYNNCKYVPNF